VQVTGSTVLGRQTGLIGARGGVLRPGGSLDVWTASKIRRFLFHGERGVQEDSETVETDAGDKAETFYNHVTHTTQENKQSDASR